MEIFLEILAKYWVPPRAAHVDGESWFPLINCKIYFDSTIAVPSVGELFYGFTDIHGSLLLTSAKKIIL